VDKTTAACSYSDQAAANSAFATWLATASVSGGCGPTSIPDITTAPPYCGGDVKVTWTIADKCYTTSTYSATFSITAPPAVVVVPAVDKTTAACSYSDQAAANSAFATWLATASVSGGCGPTSIPDITTAPPYCGGDVKVTWRIADKCYDGMTYSATFTITVPEPLVISNVTDLIIPGCTYGTQEDLNAAFALWLEGFTVSGGCDPKGVFADNYTAPDSVTGGFVDVVYNVTDLCENGSDIARYTVGPCVNAHCTYTQGYYGNLGGISCADGKSYTTLALISKALSSPLYNGTMRIGLEGNSVLVSNTDADKNAILAVLPGGGSSYKLLTGNPQISALTGSFSSYLTKKGTLNNTLLAQTITLGLNLGIDGTLGGFGLQAGLDQYGKPIELATAAPQGGCGSNIPMPRSCSIGEGYGSVVNEYGYFQFPAFVNGMTVQELFTAANQALADGTLPMGVTMSTLANAVDMVNNAFDGCRIAIGYGVERLECKTSSAQEFVAFKVPIVNNQLTIKYKFSYVSDVTIDVFDAVTGAKVFSKLDTNSYLDKEVELDYNFNTGTERVYIVRLTTRLGHDEQKVMSDPY